MNEPCYNSMLESFWMPDNWPGLRAPARVDFFASPIPGRVHVSVSMWMRLGRDWPDSFPQPHGLKRGDDGLAWWGTSTTYAGAQAAVDEGTRYLEQQREIEFGGLAMATEALLEVHRG